MKHLIIFHRDCLDGMAAAYIAGKYFGFDNVEFYPADYDDDTMPEMKGRSVYILDFSFSPEQLLPILDDVASVVMIDHHRTAINKWEAVTVPQSSERFLFIHDTTKSGAGLAWDFFFPDTPMPLIIKHCQDYDLWQFKLDNTKAIATALYSKPMIRDLNWDLFGFYVANNDYLQLLAEGNTIFAYQTTTLLALAKRIMVKVNFMGYPDIPMMPCDRAVHSEAGGILARNAPFSVTYEDYPAKGTRRYSLRSNEHSDTSVNVLVVAEAMGGGGHPHAAGFSVPLIDSSVFQYQPTNEQAGLVHQAALEAYLQPATTS